MAETDKPVEDAINPPGSGVQPETTETKPLWQSDRSDPIADAEVVEPEPEPKPEPRYEPRPDPIPAPAAPAPRRSGSFLGFVVGGVLAAAAGFGLARVLPDGWPMPNAKALEDALAAQTAEVTALKQQIADLAAGPVSQATAEVAALKGEIDARIAELPKATDPAPLVAEARAALESALAQVDERLTAVEKRPATGGAVSDTALAAYERDLMQLRSDFEAQRNIGTDATIKLESVAAETRAQLDAAAAEAAALKAEAEAAVKAATDRAALSRLQGALESGGPFASAVADLSAAGIEIPAVLADSAANGLPTLPDLQEGFPAAARAALDAALKSDAGDNWADRLTSFLRSETGARSLEPREGTDPDAVLSRAEAALDDGQLAPALTELAALPDAAKAAMSDWMAAAQTRLSATEAVATVAAAMDAK